MHRAGKSGPLFVIAALAVALVVSWVRPLVGAVPPLPPNAMPGRFQSCIAASSSHLVVTDTATGQCWSIQLIGRDGWRFLGAPEVTDAPLPEGARKE